MNKEITSGRLTEVIKVDTTSSSRADFLATHVPFRHIKLKHGGGLSQDFETISEDEIWQQYVREPGERHQFIVVQGAEAPIISSKWYFAVNPFVISFLRIFCSILCTSETCCKVKILICKSAF